MGALWEWFNRPFKEPMNPGQLLLLFVLAWIVFGLHSRVLAHLHL